VFLKEKCGLSKRDWIDLSIQCRPFVDFPTYNTLKDYSRDLVPTLHQFHLGLRADLLEVVQLTLQRLPPNVVTLLCAQGHGCSTLAKFIAGADASGNHKVYNSVECQTGDAAFTHFMVAGIALTEVALNDSVETTLYKVPNLSSDDNERPLVIAPGKETREFFGQTLDVIKKDLDCLLENSIPITYQNEDRDDLTVMFKVHVELSQLDGKAKTAALGLGGAFYTMCTVSRLDGKNVDRIKEKFRITRNITNIQQLFDDLSVDENGEELVPRAQGDYDVRAGLTQIPLTTQDTAKNFPILHSYLRVFGCLVQLAYRLNAGVHKMGLGIRLSDYEKKKIKAAKEAFQGKGKLLLGISIDAPNPHGGTSDTGNNAR
jgi:hypothetical protein